MKQTGDSSSEDVVKEDPKETKPSVNKGQKRKPGKAAEPAKKKAKVEGEKVKKEEVEEENASGSESGELKLKCMYEFKIHCHNILCVI